MKIRATVNWQVNELGSSILNLFKPSPGLLQKAFISMPGAGINQKTMWRGLA